MRESWTYEQLDDLNGRVSNGFRRLDARIDRVDGDLRDLRGEVRDLRTEMNARFDTMQRTMARMTVALSAAMLAGFAGLAGLIATQL